MISKFLQTEWESSSRGRTVQAVPGMSYSNANKAATEPIKVLQVAPRQHVPKILLSEEEEEDEWEYLDETEVYLRSKFYESWLWVDVNLPSETDKDG